MIGFVENRDQSASIKLFEETNREVSATTIMSRANSLLGLFHPELSESFAVLFEILDAEVIDFMLLQECVYL